MKQMATPQKSTVSSQSLAAEQTTPVAVPAKQQSSKPVELYTAPRPDADTMSPAGQSAVLLPATSQSSAGKKSRSRVAANFGTVS